MTQTVGNQVEEIHIRVAAGEPVDFTVPVVDEDGVPVNPTGWDALAQIRLNAGASLLDTLTLTPGTSGVRVQATATQTATWDDWTEPVARWDLWVTPTAEDPRPLARGRVFVDAPISTP